MPRHDDNHAPSDVDAAITVVVLIVLVGLLLFLAGATRPNVLGQSLPQTELSVPAGPPV
jgi:hypothetical protein